MKIFVTGATGFIGSAIVQELLRAGHRVLGLARSDAAAAAVTAAGAEAHRGDLVDAASLRAGAAASDAVVHTGFIHDFTRYKEVCATDRHVIAALGAALVGTQRPLLVSSGVVLPGGKTGVTEDDRATASPDALPRVATELACDELAARGVHVGVLRFPTVHGEGDHGFVPMLIELARKQGASAYVGEGQNLWPAVHRFDAATLTRLALAQPFAPGTRFHVVAEEGVPFKAIAEAIGRRLQVPVVSKSPADAAAHFGWFAHFAALDCRASSKRTRETLGWTPVQPDLLADLDRPPYFAQG
ncbi:SDR family oxidoreductase [Nannocystis pusilla]|uniref:SDR family oxidoreductase n=1 Tax=Nannocystis pusilla TaxID=889268 RepID=UPI003B7A7D2B